MIDALRDRLEGAPKRPVLVKEVNPPRTNPLAPRDDARLTGLVAIPAPGAQNVAGGATYDFTQEAAGNQPWRVVRIYLDFPEGVTGTLELDGVAVAQTTDDLGLVGVLEVGDLKAHSYLPVRKARIHGTVTASEDRDLRAWLVVVVT